MDHAYHTKMMLLEACESSSPGEFHPQALYEPNVNLLIYPALLIQSISKINFALLSCICPI
jgi:hypothetical protein